MKQRLQSDSISRVALGNDWSFQTSGVQKKHLEVKNDRAGLLRQINDIPSRNKSMTDNKKVRRCD